MAKFNSKQLLDRIEEGDIVELCRNLVRFRTINPPGDELESAKYISEILGNSGLSVEIVPHTTTRASLISRLKGSGDSSPILFCGHLDVVPIGAQDWTYDPFEGRVAGGRLWGRGAADMKGGNAAMIIAAKILAESQYPLRGDLVLAFTAGEEGEKLGSSALASRKDLTSVQAVVIAEPSRNDIYIAEKGAFWLEITTHGKTAHGSMPEYGNNAIMMMMALIGELENPKSNGALHPLLGSFTRSVNTIHGGVKTNVVPDQCVITLDQRTVPGQNHKIIMRELEDIIKDLEKRIAGFRATIKITYDCAPVATSPNEPIVREFCAVVEKVTGKKPVPTGTTYCTDAGVLVPAFNVPLIVCGPGDPKLAHQPDEHVKIDKLVEATKIMLLAAAEILN